MKARFLSSFPTNLFGSVFSFSRHRGITEVTHAEVPRSDGSGGSFANYVESSVAEAGAHDGARKKGSALTVSYVGCC